MNTLRAALASFVLLALALVACAAWALARRLKPDVAMPPAALPEPRIVVPPPVWPPAWQVHDVRVMDVRQ